MRLGATTVALMLAAGAAQADPLWKQAPTYADAVKAYPSRARAAHLGGGASVTCTVNVTGHLRDCAVWREKPDGYGFGNAARKLGEQMRAVRGPEARDARELRVVLTFHPEMADGTPYIAQDAVWLDLPSPADFAAAFTDTGANSVRVALVCDVVAGGWLSGCVVDQEAPAGQGYGTAAVKLAPKIRIGLLAADGTPLVGAKVRVPLRYELTPKP